MFAGLALSMILIVQSAPLIVFNGYYPDEAGYQTDSSKPHARIQLNNQDYRTMQNWLRSFDEAIRLFPEKIIQSIRPISLRFFADPNTWETANAHEREIGVNLRPSIIAPEWMTWEPLPLNGYSHEERLFLAVHELAHTYEHTHPQISNIWQLNFTGSAKVEPFCSLYAEHMDVREDFADAVAIYILYPRKLKQGFPKHYELLKTIIGHEYPERNVSIPASVGTKLAPSSVKVH